MLEKAWTKGNTPLLLVGMKTCTAILKISMSISQKIGNQSTSRPSNITLWHIPKRCTFIPKGHVLNYIHDSIINNSWNL